MFYGTFLQIRKRRPLWMDTAPTHALSQGHLRAGYNLLNPISWSCNLPSYVYVANFLELRAAFIHLPFTFLSCWIWPIVLSYQAILGSNTLALPPSCRAMERPGVVSSASPVVLSKGSEVPRGSSYPSHSDLNDHLFSFYKLTMTIFSEVLSVLISNCLLCSL